MYKKIENSEDKKNEIALKKSLNKISYKHKNNILDYIYMRGDLSFRENPFNYVDGLIFSQLIYNKIEGLLDYSFKNKITLRQLAQIFRSSSDFESRINMGAMINELTPSLLMMAAESNRFGNVKICGFKSVYDENKIEQFAAITYEINEGEYVVSFRGTDDTILGWYEDFNLGYMDNIPSHLEARDYLKDAMDNLKGNFVITGHSKGGNVVVKAGALLNKKYQKRLRSIINYDGPGFYEEFYFDEKFLQIKDITVSLFPTCCYVGMMFEHIDNFSIIQCAKEGIYQHDPFNWNVKGCDFETTNSFDKKSEFFYNSFNDWAKNLKIEERKQFIDSFFKVMFASGVKTNYEIEQNKIVCGGKMIQELAGLNEEQRNGIVTGIKQMVVVTKNYIPMISVIDIKENLKDQFKKLRR